MKKCILVVLTVFLSSCFFSEDAPPDQKVWTYNLPSSYAKSDTSLLFIDSLLTEGAYEQINGIIIIKEDELIFENYYRGSDRASLMTLGTASASISWAALGILIDLGTLSIEDEIAPYLTSYSRFFEMDSLKNDITIKNLLLNQSGISWNETVFNYLDPKNDLNLMKKEDDWINYILSKPMTAPPGLFTDRISSANYILLTKVIEAASNMPFDLFLEKYLFTPLEITNYTIDQDLVGNFDGATGIQVSLLDWTKLGYLTMQGGFWQNRSVIDFNFIEASTSVQLDFSESIPQNIGYTWLIFDIDFFRENIIMLDGSFGQQLYLAPERNLIVAIASENFFPNSLSNRWPFFNSLILFESVLFS